VDVPFPSIERNSMRVVIAGGHGQIARKLEQLLAARGDQAVGIVRNPDHTRDLESKLTVDRDAAILLADAAVAAGVRRFLVVSSMGAGSGSPDSHDVMDVYNWAKGQADDAVSERDLDVTIVRPGRLTDGDSTGRVTAGTSVEGGEIAREDVALVLLAVLDREGLTGKTFEVVGGGDEIDYALTALG
jgi:uncharacterized protein YbjT (DUF2867 family)